MQSRDWSTYWGGDPALGGAADRGFLQVNEHLLPCQGVSLY